MIMIKEGDEDKVQNSPFKEVVCPYCDCKFAFKESDIENVVDYIYYDKGIKKVFQAIKDAIVTRYITCPWCKAKLKLKFTVETTKEVKRGTTKH